MEELLTHVQSSVDLSATVNGQVRAASDNFVFVEQDTGNASGFYDTGYDDDADGMADDVEFDDTGEGAGVEGDLDMDDD